MGVPAGDAWDAPFDVAFAQGSHEGHNIWWMGSPTFSWTANWTQLASSPVPWTGAPAWNMWDWLVVDSFWWAWVYDPWPGQSRAAAGDAVTD